MRAPARWKFVWIGGLVAGTLDILFAITFWAVKANVPAKRILQSVAAGLLGRASFDGGWQTALLGLMLHFFIAISMSFAYFETAKRWPLLRNRPAMLGAAYGLVLYLFMNLVVLPLSAAGRPSRDPLWIGLSILVHAFFIGVPIALSARRALSAQ